MRVGAVDCGTNTIRLLVADRASGGPTVSLRDVVRRAEIVRLGSGVDRTGQLDPAAIERTLARCREYARTCRVLHCDVVRFVGTSASRDAANGDEFTSRVRATFADEGFPVHPEVLTGEEEARFSFLGATLGLTSAYAEPYLVVDLGGGSTEFVRGDHNGITAALSVDVGSVRLTERVLASDPPTAAEIDEASALIATELNRVDAHVGFAGIGTLIGLAGTVTSLAAVALELPAYEASRVHLTAIPNDRMSATCRRLIAMTRAERAAATILEPGRIDVIGAGALIWSAVLDRVSARSGLTAAVTSEHDILDGIAATA